MTDTTVITPCKLEHGVLLVVEDDMVILDVMKNIIGREGIDYVIATSAEEALSILGDGKTDVQAIVTDVVLPGISGIGLARAVHEKHNDMAFLFCTAVNDPSTSNLMWQHGIVYNKPIVEDFPAALRRLIMCATAKTKASENCELSHERRDNERRVTNRRKTDVKI